MTKKFHGIMPPVLTPMDENGNVDKKVYARYINFLIDGGVHAVIVNGSMGEFFSLTEEERNETAKFVISEVNGRVPVIICTGHSGTRPAVELSKKAESFGADGIQVMPPYYIIPTEEGIYSHYKSISDSINIPIFIYNNFGVSKIALSAKLITRLSKIKNIIGVKLSPGGPKSPLELAKEIRELTQIEKPDFIIMIATASLWLYGLELGISDGCVMGLPNVFPDEYVKIYNLLVLGNIEEARKINQKFLELDHLSTTVYGGRPRYQYIYKTMLKWRGIIPSNTVRKPLMPVEETYLNLLRKALNSNNYKWL